MQKRIQSSVKQRRPSFWKSFKPLTISMKRSILDVWLSTYASDIPEDNQNEVTTSLNNPLWDKEIIFYLF